jgi:hypothetical protein
VTSAAALVSCSCGGASSPASSSGSELAGPPVQRADGGGACLPVGDTTTSGTVDAPDIDEASGIASSAINPDVFWTHNDSGDSARAFALSRTGALMATLYFDAKTPTDIEDMAIEDVGPGESALYFGDIGDNDAVRTSVTIHRVAEPKLVSPSGPPPAPVTITAASEKMQVTYPDGPHDAETLLFDPITKDLFIVTKLLFGRASVHRVGPFAGGASVRTEVIARVGVSFATGGAISRDGRLIAIRNYGQDASVWMRAPGETVAAALGRDPCKVPVAAEPQGEGFAFLAGAGPGQRGYVTISEGHSPELHVTLFQ